MKASGDYRERAEAIARDILTLDRPHELQHILAESIAQALEDAANAARLEEREAIERVVYMMAEDFGVGPPFARGHRAVIGALGDLTDRIRARGAAQGTPGEALSPDEVHARLEHDPGCPAREGVHDKCQC